MDEKAYKKFQVATRNGLRPEAKKQVRIFINSFKNFDEKRGWVDRNFNTLLRGPTGYIRHELFAEVVFPVLRDGFEKKSVSDIIRLAYCQQNLSHGRTHFWEIFPLNSFDLWREAYKQEPENKFARQGYLNAIVDILEYDFHGWPSGLLGVDCKNWQQESDEISELIELAKDLDAAGRHSNFLDSLRRELEEFRVRMANQ